LRLLGFGRVAITCLVCSIPGFSLSAGPNIITKVRSVAVGGTVQFKADRPVTWSLAPGSVGRIDAEGTYHAPPSIEINNQIAGCQLLPNDHILNTRVDKLPINPDSDALMAIIPPSGVGYYVSWGTNVADQTTPRRQMHFLYTPQDDGIFEIPEWPHLKRENGVFSSPTSGVDRHVVTVDRDTCEVFELYNNYSAGTNTQCATCTGQSGLKYPSNTYTLPQGATDAAGLMVAPLTLRLQDVYAGTIRHALRVTLANSRIRPDHVWPGSSNAGAWGKIPYGTRFRLKANFDTSAFSPIAKILLTQLKEYGLILADGGADFEVDADTDLTEDPAVNGALGEVHRVSSREFEIVNESPLMVAPNSGEIRFGNPYEMPDSGALVIATARDNPSHFQSVRIAIRGVTIGLPDPMITIQSGVSKQLRSWVTGTPDQKVTWTMNGGLGSLTPGGIYTAPDVQAPTRTTLTVSSDADPHAKAILGVYVLPKGGIRIDVGNATGSPHAPNHYAPDYGPDSAGHMWWRELGGEVAWGIVNDSWGEPWPKIPDIGVFYTNRYALGDMVYRFTVPNGRYKITLLFGQNECKGSFDPGTKAPVQIETQGKIVLHDFDWGEPVHHACNAPVTQDIPAVVTDDDLYFAIRCMVAAHRPAIPLLNGFAITPDDSTPHLAIIPARASTSFGHDMQFHAVGWGVPDSVTWSLVQGPGSVTADGLYKGPSSPPSAEQTIVVQAKSIANAALVSKATLKLDFGTLAVNPASVKLQRSLKQQFVATLNDLPYKNVVWSLSPEVGSISQSGVYQAPDSISHDTSVTVSAQSRDVPARAATGTVQVQAKKQAIRVNCGGGPFRDAQGNEWSGDHGFTPSLDNSVRVPIAGAGEDMQALYDSSRYAYPHNNFSYNFDLPNGKYSVTLKFADYSYTDPNRPNLRYIFNVVLNGRNVLDHFDPDREAGVHRAIDKTFQVAVDHQHMQIEFIPQGESDAIVNGIEIVPED
jgi:hypothetical protein